MGEYVGGPVTVREGASVFLKPEEITVDKLRDLLNDPEFSCPPDTRIQIGPEGAVHEGLVEVRFDYVILSA